MSRRWLAVIVLAAGCRIGGGPMLGYRAGKPTVGWEAGPGLIDDSDPDGSFRLDLGQSYREGRPFTYGTVTGERYFPRSNGLQWLGVGGSFGGGGGADGAHVVGGAALDLGGWRDNPGCAHGAWMMSISAGVRLIAGDMEVFVAPRFDYVTTICFD